MEANRGIPRGEGPRAEQLGERDFGSSVQTGEEPDGMRAWGSENVTAWVRAEERLGHRDCGQPQMTRLANSHNGGEEPNVIARPHGEQMGRKPGAGTDAPK